MKLVSTLPNPKICIQCNHFRGKRYALHTMDYIPECFKTKQDRGINIVTGESEAEYLTCEQTRSNETLCGLEGKWFELYVKPDYSDDPIPLPVKKVSVKSISAEDL